MLHSKRCQRILGTDLAAGKEKIRAWVAARTDFDEVNLLRNLIYYRSL